MTRWIAVLLAAMVAVGCASPAHPPQVVSSASSAPVEVSEPVPQPLEYLLPLVPLYPGASDHVVLADQRADIQVRGEAAAKVLGWYRAALPAHGWEEEQTGLPPEMVLLFSREGEYLSLAGHDWADGQGSVLWFHLRTTREVTEEAALAIARNTHRVEAEWTATLLRDFDRERYGAGGKHPVWMVEALPGNDAVWVDAVTAEPFRIRE